MNHLVWQTVFQLLPMALLVLGVAFWVKLARWKAGRYPFDEPMHRSPGESLRERTEQLSERVLFIVIGAMLVTVVIAVSFSSDSRGQGAAHQLDNPWLWLIWVGTPGVALVGLIRVLKRLRDCRLGYEGERYVGQLLNELLRQGCHVFHDLPADKLGNIDHIVVSPTGVFAIETKTRRKRKGRKGGLDHQLEFDGRQITFSNGGYDKDCVEQARRNAGWLRKFLAEAAGENVPVTPLLVFPGWYVSSRVNVELKVLNPKSVRPFISGSPAVLSADQIQRIVFQIDQKCRVKE